MKKQTKLLTYLFILSMIISIVPSTQVEAKSKKANKQAQKVYDYVNNSLFDEVENFVLNIQVDEENYYYSKSGLKKLEKNLRKKLKKGKSINKVVKKKLKAKKYKAIRKYWKKLYTSAQVIHIQAQLGTFQDKSLIRFRKNVKKFDAAYVKLYKNDDYEFRSSVPPYDGVDWW